MQEMARLKASIKELNAKQIALNQEKAHLEAKVNIVVFKIVCS